MTDQRTIDRTVIVAASRKAETAHTPPPYGPPTPTGLTTPQQWALYYSRKHRKQRLGVVPRPPLP
jgi:hypothetical protein